MNYENPILVLPCYLQLSEAARLAYGVTKAELDDFLMYEFKVKRCAKAYPHQWMTCPFAHRGEKARRRDPRRFPNHGIPCPEFRQTGACRRGQKCEFAHGVFEFWLHPTRYRTRMCISGPACRRKICFFAHTVDELRPEGLGGGGGGGVPAGVGKLAEGTSAGRPEERGEEFAEPDLRWMSMKPRRPRREGAACELCFLSTVREINLASVLIGCNNVSPPSHHLQQRHPIVIDIRLTPDDSKFLGAYFRVNVPNGASRSHHREDAHLRRTQLWPIRNRRSWDRILVAVRCCGA
ncbi:hypothetical protein B296_00016787 [Ensete ventricosum]|uniref:C3H1-type domain-containing protein n=1 Tax=Ensete ventricosum TaxID=4639 RepID=A0A426ZPM4_ENSVE|nr:hypothetical protein B296_00016787 [Ensete ventricosum]